MRTTPYAQIFTKSDGKLELFSSYEASMVTALKARIPSTARRWDPLTKCWKIDAQYGGVVADLIEQYLGVNLTIPLPVSLPPLLETRTIKLEYLGQAKDRGDGIETAFGYTDGDWSIIIPLSALKTWFDVGDQRPDEGRTLYQVLSIGRQATLEEIHKAYRRLAKQWHPDICREPDAGEQFKAIQHSYSVLSNEQQRKKYDWALTATTGKKDSDMGWQSRQGWRSPLRCGWLLVEGRESLGRFVVSKILAWEDITDSLGRTMVTSWPIGTDTFVTNWV